VSEWNQILREKRYSKEEPDESVVNFVSLLKKGNKKLRVLDLGCGAGRHQVYMASQGIETHGIDLSETGLNLTKERLKQQKLESHLIKCDMNSLPYVSFCFDAVISLHTIYHQRLKGIQKVISEIRRVLKTEGFLLVNFLSKRTYSYGKGVEIEEDTFIEQEGAEKGVIHHFADEEEVKRLFSSFKIVDLKLIEWKVDDKLSSRWMLIAMV
jgi:ubiquinone/menaquinone biosynthesis C-methylase UbiE